MVEMSQCESNLESANQLGFTISKSFCLSLPIKWIVRIYLTTNSSSLSKYHLSFYIFETNNRKFREFLVQKGPTRLRNREYLATFGTKYLSCSVWASKFLEHYFHIKPPKQGIPLHLNIHRKNMVDVWHIACSTYVSFLDFVTDFEK